MSDRRIIALLNGFIGGILARISGPGAFRIISTVTADRDLTLPDANCTLTAGTSIAGAVANTQVAVGNGTNTVAGNTALTFSAQTLTSGNGTASAAYFQVNTGAGQDRGLIAQTAGLNRWLVRFDATAESGSDAGTNFVLRAYNDAGVAVSSPISVIRAAGGLITLARPTSITNTTDSTSTATGSLITAGGFGAAMRAFLGAIGSTFKGNVLAGVQDGTAAVAGQVGEVLSSTVTGVAVAATGTVGNATSLSLTAGDWIISAHGVVSGGATGLTAGSVQKLSIVTTTATNGVEGDTMQVNTIAALTANGKHGLAIPQIRINISATTTHYLTQEVTYAAGSPTIAAKLIATRVR